MKVRNRKYPWPGSGRQLRRVLLNATPFDGCLLLFNANERDFRKLSSELLKGMLKISNVGVPLRKGTTYHEAITDLYIVWKEG